VKARPSEVGYRLSGRSSPLGKAPRIVAMPRSVEHIQEIVKLANREKVTLLPFVLAH